VVVLAGLLVYLNAIPADFVFDDLVLIRNNKAFLDSALNDREWLAWFGRHYWWGKEDLGTGEEVRAELYRPVTILSYAVNAQASGLDARVFHAVNVVLHAGVGLLVLGLGRRLVGPAAALLGALLFAVHPLHTEAVTGIVGRAELLAALFGLASVLCAFRAAAPSARGWAWWGGAGVGLFFLALLSKEHVATLPVWLALALAVEREGRSPRRSILIVASMLAAGVVHYAIWRGVITAWGGPVPIPEINNPTVGVPVVVRWLTAAAVTLRYAWLFVWPARLSPDYSYAEILPSRGLGVAELGGIALIAGLVGVIVLALRRHPGLGLALAFVPVTFFVVSNFPFPIGAVMAERLTYLPTVGACLAVGWALARLGWRGRPPAVPPRRASGGPGGLGAALAPSGRWGWVVAGLCAAALVGYAARTVVRNLDWRDEYTLFASAKTVSTRSFKVRLNLASAAMSLGRPHVAVEAMEESLELNPPPEGTVDLLKTLADAYLVMGRPAQAEQSLRRAIQVSGAKALAPHLGLGEVYIAQGRDELAAEQYRATAALFPDSVTPRHNLGNVLWRMGRMAEAEQALRDTLRLKPDFVAAHLSLGGLLLQSGRILAAREQFEQALRLRPNDPKVLYGMFLAASRLGDLAAAQQYRGRAAARLRGLGPAAERFVDPSARPRPPRTPAPGDADLPRGGRGGLPVR